MAGNPLTEHIQGCRDAHCCGPRIITPFSGPTISRNTLQDTKRPSAKQANYSKSKSRHTVELSSYCLLKLGRHGRLYERRGANSILRRMGRARPAGGCRDGYDRTNNA